MKANITHISLETAKLLKDCGVESQDWYCKLFIQRWDDIFECQDIYLYIRDNIKFLSPNHDYRKLYPAYTWNEILWEYPKEFFGKKWDFVTLFDLATEKEYVPSGWKCNSLVREQYYITHTKYILHLLQQKKYNEADKYFRENCVLIKK
jgi:hypothetical protein